jgi:hypothetical protein
VSSGKAGPKLPTGPPVEVPCAGFHRVCKGKRVPGYSYCRDCKVLIGKQGRARRAARAAKKRMDKGETKE